MIKFVDMFSGIGGFREGLTRAGGFECVGHCEIDKYANRSYNALFDTKGEWFIEDARKADPGTMPEFQLLCGGFPCQSFSVAGARRGFSDPRGTLFFEIARLVEARHPAYLILENVPGLLSHSRGETYATILNTLDRLGYGVEWQAYVNIGAVTMGIAGSFCDAGVLQKYFGIRAEWVDEVEILRRISIGIYDHDEYEKALAWVRENCKEGFDKNLGKNLPPVITKSKIVPADKDWEFIVKMTLIIRDILYGNPRLDEMGWHEEALGRNAVVGGFQGQRQWTDWLPNADFTEAIMASTFDWNGPKAPTPFATENDTCNGIAMMLGSLVSGSAPCFHDVRTYWSPEACERVTGQKPDGVAANGFIHLINSGATALDGSGACVDAKGNHVMKPFWEMTDADIKACLKATDWCRADYEYFRGGGYSSHFRCKAEMPVTMLRFNIVEGIGPVLQIAEGWTADLPDEIHNTIDKRTDPTWPTTWFCPRLTGQGAFTDVYSVMANWGANHGVTVYGHVGADLITLASMLRIPVTMHNVPAEKVYRPHAWASFGTQDQQAADYAACKQYGPLYR